MKITINDLAKRQAEYLIQNLPLFVNAKSPESLENGLKEVMKQIFGEVANTLEGLHSDTSGEAHRISGNSALDVQVGGSHYQMPIQHVEFCQKNRLPWCESAAIKYLIRHKRKNGLQDVRKAIHYIELMAEMEYNVTPGELHQKDAKG